MAKQLFKGFKQVLFESGMTFENGYIYFVRESEDKENGFLYFNGKKYGTTKAVADKLADLAGKDVDLENQINNIETQLSKSTVKDVEYNRDDKYIRIVYNDNTRSTGFDASDFIVDGMLSSVTYDTSAHTMTFIWNTDAKKEEITVNLDQIITPYRADEQYIHLGNGNIFEAVIGEIGFDEETGKFTVSGNTALVNTTVLVDAVNKALEKSIKSFSVNGVEAQVDDARHASVVINSENIKMGKEVNYSGATIATTDNTIGQAIDKVVEKVVNNKIETTTALEGLDNRLKAVEAEETKHTSNDKTIKVVETTGDAGKTTVDLSVNVEQATDETVAAGHIELQKNGNGELFAFMYFDGNDIA